MKTTVIASTFAATLAFAPAVTLAQHGGNSQHNLPMSGGHSMKMGRSGMHALSGLSSKAFDIAFLSQMIPHHQGAIDMSRDALPRLRNPQVKQHAQRIIADQTREIAQMTTLLQKGYGVKPSPEQARLMKADMQPMMAVKTQGDRMFLQMMIPHHQGAIDMSRLALHKSGNAQVKRLAASIIKGQTAEIADFQHLLHGGNLAAAAPTRVAAAAYQCQKCKMTFSAVDAKKNGYKCTMEGGKLVAVKPK